MAFSSYIREAWWAKPVLRNVIYWNRQKVATKRMQETSSTEIKQMIKKYFIESMAIVNGAQFDQVGFKSF